MVGMLQGIEKLGLNPQSSGIFPSQGMDLK